MIKLNDLQAKLDKRKWLESKKYNRDCSGLMAYCAACKWQSIGTCRIPQNVRKECCECAKAFNKMRRMGVMDKDVCD